MGKDKQVNWEQELQECFSRWDYLKEHGGSDPFWSDGVNLNLLRNHIIFTKRELEHAIPLEAARPEIYYREIPPEVSDDYYVNSGKIRDEARWNFEKYISNEDFQYLLLNLPGITREEEKATSIKNVVGYVKGLAHSIREGDMNTMRRHVLGYDGYIESFASCAKKLRALREESFNQKEEIRPASIDRK